MFQSNSLIHKKPTRDINLEKNIEIKIRIYEFNGIK